MAMCVKTLYTNSTLVIKLFQPINAPLIQQVSVNQHFLILSFFPVLTLRTLILQRI